MSCSYLNGPLEYSAVKMLRNAVYHRTGRKNIFFVGPSGQVTIFIFSMNTPNYSFNHRTCISLRFTAFKTFCIFHFVKMLHVTLHLDVFLFVIISEYFGNNENIKTIIRAIMIKTKCCTEMFKS